MVLSKTRLKAGNPRLFTISIRASVRGIGNVVYLNRSARTQTQPNCPAPGTQALGPIYTVPVGGHCSDFVDCFVTGGNINCYGIPLTPNNGNRCRGI